MKIIAVSAGKGGTGKSTTVWHVSIALTQLGKKVLIVDLDPEQHLSNWLSQKSPYERQGIPTISELIYQEISGFSAGEIEQFICRSSQDDIDYIPSNKMLSGILKTMGDDSDKYTVLDRLLHKDFFAQYDYVLLDCAPGFDLLVTNAFKCCDRLLVPVQALRPSYEAIPILIEKFMIAKKTKDIAKYIQGFAINMYATNTTDSEDIYNGMKQGYGNLVFDKAIPRTVFISDCVGNGRSVLYSNNKKSLKARQAYLSIAQDIIDSE